MREPTITKIKNGKITLPKDLRQAWKGGQVVFVPTESGFYVKSVTPPSLDALASRLRKLGKSLTSKDIKNAVAWAKKKTYASRA